MTRTTVQAGFTLVEVLVAIAIFAVLSAAGWQVFDQLIKTRERNQQHGQNLMQLQSAYSQILRDFNQMVPIAGQRDEISYPALSLQSQNIQFNRAGVIDPLQQGLDRYEFVEYQYDVEQKALKRYKSNFLYRQDQQNMQADIIVAPIENLRFQALDPLAQEDWPVVAVQDANIEKYLHTQLPRGVEMTFEYQHREYRWVFNLVQTLPNPNVEPNQHQGNPDEQS